MTHDNYSSNTINWIIYVDPWSACHGVLDGPESEKSLRWRHVPAMGVNTGSSSSCSSFSFSVALLASARAYSYCQRQRPFS